MLISDAPWEIIWMVTSGIAPNTRAAMPGVLRMFSPTRQTIALRPSYFTSASFSRSAAMAAIASEDVEDAFEEAVGHEHARGYYVHDRDAFFGGDGLEDVFTAGRGGR